MLLTERDKTYPLTDYIVIRIDWTDKSLLFLHSDSEANLSEWNLSINEFGGAYD